MFINVNNKESYDLSQMSSMNEDQGALLTNERTVQDDYVLSYRFEEKYFFVIK
jgi:hypothetical protein